MKSQVIRLSEGELLLITLRAMALVLALVLIIFFVEIRTFLISAPILIGTVVFYSVARILYPSYWYGNNKYIVAIIVLDVVFCCFLPFVSGGVHSPFILFPLTAILSVAIFTYPKIAYAVATVAGVSVVASEMLWHYIFGEAGLLPIQMYITLMAFYVVVSYLIAWLPFVGSTNLSTNIKQRAIVEERSRLSRELHDGLAQRISTLILECDLLMQGMGRVGSFNAAKQLTKLRENLRSSLGEVRDVIDELRLELPEEPDMLPVLTQYTQEFARSAGIDCKLYISDGQADMKPVATLELLRILQEALRNVKKHSDANLVEVTFESGNDMVHLRIKDNGCGFTEKPHEHNYGLSIMKERARSLGGKCEITSAPGSGTEIHVTVPMAQSRLFEAIGHWRQR